MANVNEVNRLDGLNSTRPLPKNISVNNMGLQAPVNLLNNVCDLGRKDKDCAVPWGGNCSSCMANTHYDCNTKKIEELKNVGILNYQLFNPSSIEGFQAVNLKGNFASISREGWSVDVDTCMRGGTQKCPDTSDRVQSPAGVNGLVCRQSSEFGDGAKGDLVKECDSVNCNVNNKNWISPLLDDKDVTMIPS